MKKVLAAATAFAESMLERFLSSDGVAEAAQLAMSRALQAKALVNRSLQTAASALELPTAAQIDALKAKVADLERTVQGLEEASKAARSRKRQRKQGTGS